MSPKPRKAPSAADAVNASGRPIARVRAYANASANSGEPRWQPIRPTKKGAVPGLAMRMPSNTPTNAPSWRVRHAKAAAALPPSGPESFLAESRAMEEEEASRSASEAAKASVKISEEGGGGAESERSADTSNPVNVD